jgi:hypothetical protein
MIRKMMMADVGLNLAAFDVFAPRRGRLVKAVRALMSKRRSHPAYTGERACAACQVR